MEIHGAWWKRTGVRRAACALVNVAVFMSHSPPAASRPERDRHDIRAVPIPPHKNPYREYQVQDLEKNTCLKTLVTLIGRAKPQRPIVVYGYDFSDDEISGALVEALDRHVNVGIVISRTAFVARRAVLELLREHGADVFIDNCAAMPGPTAVIDNFVVVTGRFHDRDEPGEQPRPTMEVLHNDTIAMVYVNEWVKHYRHSHVSQAPQNAQ